jgi:hypothetical protein
MPRNPEDVLTTGSDQQKLDLVTSLVKEGIRLYQHSGRVVCCGSATLTEKLRTKITALVLNAKRPIKLEALKKKIALSIKREAPRVKKQLEPDADPDFGPFALTSHRKRYPGQRRTSAYGLSPDARYDAPDAFELAALPATKLPAWGKSGTPYEQSNSQFTLPPDVRVGEHVLNRVVGDKAVDENVGGPERHYHPQRVLDSATLDSLDESFLWNAREHGLRLIVRRDLNLGITSKQLVAAALEMSQELISAEVVSPPKRKSEAKVPAFPKWTEVAAKLKLHPRTAQIAVQKLKQYPPNKLFELVPAEDSLCR